MSRVIENPKKLILNTAKDILYNSGYQKLSMRNVASTCNIALGTIYNYYPTKKELVIDMMTDYWREFIFKTQAIAGGDWTFYDKLEKVFNELSTFVGTFKEVWLKPELYDKPDYLKEGAVREDVYIEKLILLIEDILKKDNKTKSNLGSYDTAKFIVMNFITIIQMPSFKYTSFEIILKELLK